MKKKLSALSLILAAILLLSGCLGSETAEPTTTSGSNTTQAKLFFDTQTPLALGYKLCYTNPQEKEDPTEKSNVYGIAAEDGSVIIAPQYTSIIPAGKNRFIAQRMLNGNYEDALVNEKNEFLIPFAAGSIYGIKLPDGTSTSTVVVQRTQGDERGYRLADTDGKYITDIFDYIDFYSYEDAHNEKSDYYGKCVFASSGSNKYLLDFNGKTIFTYSEQPQPVLNLPNSSLVKTTALANGRVCFGVADKSGKTIVPCEYYQLSLIGKTRIYVQQGYPGGFEAGDKAAIYDTDGKIVCPYGRFLGIQYKHDYKSGTTASTGIAYELNDGGKAPELCYLVNQDGKKLTGAYESLNANDDGSFTAVKDGKTVTLTADGKVA